MKTRFISVLILAAAAGGMVMANDVGAVYTMTNDPAGNAVVAYSRASDGTLTESGTFSTGGTSIGAFATGNQNGILLSSDAHCLWAVNSLSNTIASFQVSGTSLSRVGVVDSNGVGPVSLTVSGNLLYVLHNGSLLAGIGMPPPTPSPDNITGFTVGGGCGLSPLAGSTQPLSKPTGTFPAEVSFDPSGSVLVVTEKATNNIDTYPVGKNGLPTAHNVTLAALHEPFGFAFDNRGQMLLTEAGCHMPTPPGVLPGCTVPPDSPGVSIYSLASNGTLTAVDTLVSTQAAQCWIVISNDQHFAFAVNALALQPGGTSGAPPAGSVTSFSFDPHGNLANIGSTPVPTALNGLPNGLVGVPVDAALSRNGKFLYVLSEGDGTIIGYAVNNGSLSFIGNFKVTAVPAITVGGPFPNGLAAQ